MDEGREFLEAVRKNHLASGNLRAILHLLIGRTISRSDGTVLSRGLTWRHLSELLRVVRWDKDAVQELGLNPDDLPPRDRQRFWYQAIMSARVDGPQARQEAEALIPLLERIGFTVK